MDSQYIGLLKVAVIRGTNLVATDLLNSTSDPYVMVSLGKQTVKTRTVKRSLNPEWDDELTVGVPSPTVQLKVEVMDKDRFSKDEFLGGTKVDLEPFVTIARKYHTETTNNNMRDLKKVKEIGKVLASQHSELVKDSPILCKGGKEVMDKDRFSKDEFLSETKVDLEPFVTIARKYHTETTNNNVRDHKKVKEIGRVLASQHSELVKDSPILCEGGKVQQNLHLKLNDAKSGEIEIGLTWVHIN